MTYNKTVWENDMVIEADALNNIENKVEELDADLSSFNIDSNSIRTQKDFLVGNTEDTTIKAIGTEIKLNEEPYASHITIQSTHGRPSMCLKLRKNNTNVGQINISNNSLHPEVSGSTSLGLKSSYFTNGYFSNSVFMGNDSTINTDSSNWYGILNFKNSDNTLRYGYIGKGTADSNALHLRAQQGDLRLIADGQNNVFIGQSDNYIYTHFGAKTWRLAPKAEIANGVCLGSESERWKTVYLTSSPNVSSDRNLKENIVYLNDEANLNNDDMYNFVKEDLKLAKYNYINNDKEVIGFIAQDVSENEKIGNILLSKGEDELLSYDTATYINILAGALQKAINKIEELESKLNG